MASEAVLERLTRLHPRLIDLSLDRVERLLAALGNPETRLPPVIHVAGTNGKGSTLAFLKAMAEAAGLTAHVYTSPHLVRFHERIGVGGAPIDEDMLEAVLAACEEANGGQPITFFEITTAAAFLAFSRVPADIALIETGLGGRFDATNVIARPALCAITPISRDHTHFLGETIAEIAFEKAGILKPGVTAVIARQTNEAEGVIRARAAQIGAPLVHLADRAPALEGLPRPALAGPHQIENAALAAACAQALDWPALDRDAIARGIEEVQWPARLQRLDGGRLSGLLSADQSLWLDGGHNGAAGAALATALDGWADRPVHLVFGHLENRPPEEFLSPLISRITRLHAVRVPGDSPSHDPEALCRVGRSLGIESRAHPNVATALSAIARETPGPAHVLICGSLYLAGAVLAEETAPG